MPSTKPSIQTSLIQILEPLVKFLNEEHGFSCLEFEDLLRQTYVDVAKTRKAKISKSEVSVRTGLSRKEVKTRWERQISKEEVSNKRYNRASRVMTGWLRDPDYREEKNAIKKIPMEGPAPSLEDLAKRYGADCTLMALKNELLRSGSIVEEDDLIRWESEGYVSGKDRIEGLHILGTDLSLLIETITHNLLGKMEETRFQKKVAYVDIPEDKVEEVREGMRRDAQELLEKWDSQLNDIWKNKDDSVPTRYLGMGLYYFEKETSGED